MKERNEHRFMMQRSPRKLVGSSSIMLTVALAFSATVSLEASASSKQVGKASWYGPGLHGKETASGERFNQHALTAAHRSLPLGIQARMTNLNNGKAVMVTINDRGPYCGGQVIDLSRAAARHLSDMGGLANVRVEAMP